MTTDKNGNKGTAVASDDDEGEEPEEDEKLNDEQIPAVVPPDGGWGWVIVFVGFMSGVIVDGIIFSFGVLFSAILVAFEDSKSRTAWIGSTMAGMYLTIGPVVSALANRYGCKMMTLIGAVIGSAALAASVFANSIDFLILTYGVIGGIGFGFIYLPCIVMVQFYFDKKRAFATGISVCGSGMGAFIFAPLNSFLISEYGWRGNILIQSAIVLHMIALGLLLRPLKASPSSSKNSNSKPKAAPLVIVDKPSPQSPTKNNTFKKSLSTQSFKTYVDNNPQLDFTNDLKFSSSEEQLRIINNVTTPTTIEEGSEETSEETALDNGDKNKPADKGRQEECKLLMEANVRSKFLMGETGDKSHNGTIVKVLNRRKSLPVNINEEVTRPFYRQDIFFSGSLMRIPQYTSRTSLKQYRTSIVSIPKEQQLTFGNRNKLRNMLCPKTIRHTINSMLDFSLLKSATFVVLCIASFITMAGFFIPFVYLADYAINVEVSKEDAAFLFSVIGIANTVGRVFSGWVSDRPNVNALFITNVALTTGGLATAFVPFLRSYHLLLVYSAVFGLAIACFASLRSIILVELLGLEKLTNAFGLLLLFQGIASMIGSPMAGKFEMRIQCV
ncbi:hypothetical protein CHUAL_001998 [Chamberlinius hualienensis]